MITQYLIKDTLSCSPNPICLTALGTIDDLHPGGGRGALSLEKGTNCGPTTAEQWLSQSYMAKKREAVIIL